MKKFVLIATCMCAVLNINAITVNNKTNLESNLLNTKDSIRIPTYNLDNLRPDSSRVARKRNRYLTDDGQIRNLSSNMDSWTGNWFLGLQGGASIYVGRPLGCADLFDRISPNIHAYAGKWISPAVGVRVNYQGYRIKDSNLNAMPIQSYHADFMYNIMSYRYNSTKDQHFDLIPFAGLGLIHNSDLHRSDFSFNYGLLAKYHLTDRLHLTAEASGLTTFQQFDGIGTQDRFGDHKFDFSIGLSVSIGKVGFRKPKAQSFTYKVIESSLAYESLDKSPKYSKDFSQQRSIYINASSTKSLPVNNYSGLNSLRARLANATKSTNNDTNTQTDNTLSSLCHCDDNTSCQCGDSTNLCASDGNCRQCDTKNESTKVTLVNGTDTLGLTRPYLCYFKISSHDLTDNKQLDYLSEIVRLANERNMSVHVIGAADSATGTKTINQRLSEDRADYITEQLILLGMSSEHIQQEALGGIEEFTPIANNRYCKIQLIPLSSTE